MLKKVPLTVILPVYRDVAMTKACIDAALWGIRKAKAHLHIVNDASPDKDMRAMLEAACDQHKDWISLHHNEKNLKFVTTVNEAIKRCNPQHDIMLLNSDVIVPQTDWLHLLQKEAYSKPRVATVTPLSDSTTISSFPLFCQPNKAPFGLSVDEINHAWKKTSVPSAEGPSGIGFCFYMRRDALDDVGLFDQKTFCDGYGEENDYCQRAIKKGWCNLITPNLYVYHRENVSFGDKHEALKKKAMRHVLAKHPNYMEQVTDFCQKDPLKQARQFRWLQLFAQQKKTKILHINHHLGGGVAHYVKGLQKVFDTKMAKIILTPTTPARKEVGTVVLDFGTPHTKMQFDLPKDYGALCQTLKSLSLNGIHYQHMLHVPSILLNLAKDLAMPHVVTVHDYWWLNGNTKLIDKKEFFCETYRANLSLTQDTSGHTLTAFQKLYKPLFKRAETVIFPSHDVYKRFGNDVYAIPNPVIAYQPDFKHVEKIPVKPFTKKAIYTVGLLGTLTPSKGVNFAIRAAKEASKQGLPLRFKLIGDAFLPLSPIKTIGPYENDAVLAMIHEQRIDVLLFPAQWPETYSQTLSYALLSGLPIAASHLGTFIQRLAGRKHTLMFDHSMDPQDFPDLLMQFLHSLEKGKAHPAPLLPFKPNVDETFYVQRYEKLFTQKKKRSYESLQFKNVQQYLATPAACAHKTWKAHLLYIGAHIYRNPILGFPIRLLPYHFLKKLRSALNA